jgi:hypothetical protein
MHLLPHCCVLILRLSRCGCTWSSMAAIFLARTLCCCAAILSMIESHRYSLSLILLQCSRRCQAHMPCGLQACIEGVNICAELSQAQDAGNHRPEGHLLHQREHSQGV